MKTLYLNCAVGAAGDMLTAALLELLADKAGAEQAVTGCCYRSCHASAATDQEE